MDDDRSLLEAILTAQVMLLARQIERDKQDRGVRRVGGNYYREALRQMRREQPAVLRALRALDE